MPPPMPHTWLLVGTSWLVVMHVSTHSSPTAGLNRRRASSHLQGGKQCSCRLNGSVCLTTWQCEAHVHS